VPAYTMPANREDPVVLRIVVRNGMSRDLAVLFLRDLTRSLEWLAQLDAPMPQEKAPSGLHH